MLDAVRVADELRHDDDAAVARRCRRGWRWPRLPRSNKVAERPGAGEGRAEYFGADQYGGA